MRNLLSGLGAGATILVLCAVDVHAQEQLLAQWPAHLTGISGNFTAAGSMDYNPPSQLWFLKADQRDWSNPAQSSYDWVAANWDAGPDSGLNCPNPGNADLASVAPGADNTGHTTAQTCADKMAAFTNSADIPLADANAEHHQMVQATYNAAGGSSILPSSGSQFTVGVQFGVSMWSLPLNHGGSMYPMGQPDGDHKAYARFDLLFNNCGGDARKQLSIGVALFNAVNPVTATAFGIDSTTQNYTVQPAIPDDRNGAYLTQLPSINGSPTVGTQTGTTQGYWNFGFSISYKQFNKMIVDENANVHVQLDPLPEHWCWQASHINSETKYNPTTNSNLDHSAVEFGWHATNVNIMQP